MEEKYDLIENIISKIFFTKNFDKINNIIKIVYVNFYLIISIIGLLVLLYLKSDYVLLYFFGLIFFLASNYALLYPDKEFLIFLYSHDLFGIIIMLVPIFIYIFSNPLMSDNPINIYIYLVISLLFILFGFILSNLVILLEKFRKIKHMSFYIMFMYIIGFIFLFILPLIFNYVYNFKLF